MFLFLHLDFIFWSVLVTFLHQSEAGTLRESVMVFSPNSPMSAFWAPTHPSLLLANIDFASQLIFYKYKVSCVENTHLTFYVHFHFPWQIPFFRFTFWSHYLFPPHLPFQQCIIAVWSSIDLEAPANTDLASYRY